MADSLGSVEARPLLEDLLDLIARDNAADCRSLPIIIEGNQSPAPLCSSKVGSANALGTLNGGAPSSGPMARIMTVFGWVPWTIKPPIITLSVVWTRLRVLMLARNELAPGLRSYTSTRATPVVLLTPRTIAV